MPVRTSLWTSWPDWLCRVAAAVLIVGAAGLHLAYLSGDCHLDLAPDEAHYWDWSRHLDWSYYSKGPLVAYLIRGSCELVGDWSVRHTGSLAFAVRLPAVLSGALLLWSVYWLSLQVYGRHPLALATVAVALTLPVVSVGSSLMTIDAPYTCCWGWALLFGYQAIRRGSWWAWPLAGLLVGLGVLAKYTMVIWLPSVALFLLTTPGYRRLLLRPGFWCMVGVTALCCLPILVWNVQHDWVTYRHNLTLAGLEGSPRQFTWEGPVALLAGQCALFLVFWFVVWVCAMVAHNPLRERDPGRRYLWWTSAPMFLLFFVFSLKTGGGELNWPITAYLSGLVLASGWLTDRLTRGSLLSRGLAQGGMALACAAGLFLTVGMHHSDWLYPLLDPLVGPPTPQNPFPIRRLDPTCRLRGWKALAEELDSVLEQLRREGVEPILAGTGWNLPGEIGVYCAGHPQAYSLGLAIGDRHSQYDLWDNPFDNPERFEGRTFVVVGGILPEIREAFTHVEPTRWYFYSDRGRPIAAFPITICRGFRKVQKKGQEVF